LYLELEALRFENAFTYGINVSAQVVSSRVMLPPLVIQPYVENAIWHGLMHRKQPGGKIAIDVYREDGLLMIKIEDNGAGREAAALLQKKKTRLQKSHGMNITAERLAIANHVYNANAHVTVFDIKDDITGQTGTRVLLTLQYKTNEGYTD
jgi:sensor histidine kinase YesM